MTLMKTTVTALALFILLLLSAGSVPAAGQEYAIEMKPGQVFEVCKSGLIACPVIISLCDDPGVVTTVDTPSGLGFKAVSPGTTLCSAGSGVGPRRLFRITVK
jgi:uncharacterized membrane protein